ncbi:aspartate dehydrogenase [Aquibaculum sediminis]|uniref:aspartate dehydrogenase n=1 Tax=Aquibaculum sediminis TaxID=3231907 RepID=UPI003454D2D9
MRFALIGQGAIGRLLLQEVAAGKAPGAQLAAILVRPGRAGRNSELPLVDSLDALLAAKPDVVVEAAGAGAVAEHGESILQAGIELAAASAAALTDTALAERLSTAARAGGTRLVVPAGAIGAIDALAAMRLAGLRQVTYRGVKPPAAWRGSAAEDRCALDSLSTATTFFSGTAREAASAFPKNANVAAIVGLAGLGLDETQVELVADPAAGGNRHEIEAEGVTGRISYSGEGYAAPDNPRTSLLTVYSLLRYLANREAALVV